MNMQQDKKDIDGAEIDIIETWLKIKPFVAKHIYLLVLTPVLFIFAAIALSKLVVPKWEAVTTVRIGKTSKLEFSEPADALASRIMDKEFIDLALSGGTNLVSEKDKEIFRSSIKARPLKTAGFIEIKIRGGSKESAISLASSTVHAIERSHSAALAAARVDLVQKLGDMEKMIRRTREIADSFRKTASSDSAMTELGAMRLIGEMEPRAAALREDITCVSPTVAISVEVEDAPVYPRNKILIRLAGLLGLFFGIAVAFARDAGGK